MRRTDVPPPSRALALAGVLLLASACGRSSDVPVAAAPEPGSDELAAHGGEPCPRRLPVGDDPSGLGFGIEEAAVQRPAILPVERAWVCEYAPAGTDRARTGASLTWRRGDAPVRVTGAASEVLPTALDDLAPPDPERACTDDLGSRWMVVLASGGDLTGVVVDDYGCRDVRLTDEPHTTPPGAEGQAGTVAGVLDGGAAVLDAVGVGSR